MPYIPDKPRQPQCPYCYEGLIVHDKHSNLFYCNRCLNSVIIPTLSYEK